MVDYSVISHFSDKGYGYKLHRKVREGHDEGGVVLYSKEGIESNKLQTLGE